jgi:threonine synthase
MVNYNLEKTISKSELDNSINNIWKYFRLLPVKDAKNIVTLQEGGTPLYQLENLGKLIHFPNLYFKDETTNPTGSFKARGLSVAISKVKEFGRKKCIIPTAGNAGGAMAAYCAKAGIDATVIMPRITPKVFKDECELFGAKLILVDGLINDCGKRALEMNIEGEYFDMSTLKEPYRLEGKKTMGYEIAEQFNWNLPDVIIYPTGGGTGLIGIWKAFEEMKQLGWITGPFPRMIAAQTSNCSPIFEAIKDPIGWKDNFKPKPSIANGLAVPYPFGIDLMLNVLAASNGETCVIDEENLIDGIMDFTKKEGILISPEGAATWKALLKLHQSGKIQSHEKVLLLNTGSGYKYLENII